MQIKTAMRHHLMPVKTAKINNTRNNGCWQGCGERKNPLALLVGIQTGAVTLGNRMEIPQKVEIRTTLQSCNHSTGYLPKEYKTKQNKTKTHHFQGIHAPLCL